MELINAGSGASRPLGSALTLANLPATDAHGWHCDRCSTRSVCELSGLLRSNRLTRSNLPWPNGYSLRSIAKGEHLFYFGELFDRVYVVKSGLFEHCISNEVGEELITRVVGPGQTLGIETLTDDSVSAVTVALQHSTVCNIPVADLVHVPKHDLSSWLLHKVLYQQP